MTETLSNATNDRQLTIAELQRQLTECIAEREEATAQQVATAHVLKIISRTPVELQVVFKALLEAAARLCEAETGIIGLAKGKYYYFEATYGTSVEFDNFVSSHPAEINRGTGMGRALVDAKTVHITDVLADPEYKYFEGQRLGGFRALLSVPLLRHGTPIGVIGLGRRAVRPFTDKQIELVTTFADQAVIAIENVRLFNETNEALERQTASAEVLQVISSSPDDLKPVFDQMLAKAMSLCEAQCGFIYQMEQGAMRAVAEIGVPPALAEYRRNNLHTGGAATPADMMRATRKPAHVHDARDSEPYRNGNLNAVAGVDLGGARTVLYVPMIRNDDIVGVINVYRQEVRPFTEEQISLLENFASQAVIAIENTRLFNETQEALARQTATSDILRVISQSPTDVQPVFDAIVLSAVRLLACDSSFIQLCDGATFWPVAEAGPEGPRQPVTRRAPIDPEANFPSRAIIARKNLLIADWSMIELPEHNRYIREQRGFNSAFYLPLLRNGECVGLLSFASKRANAFGDSEMSLAESFRDQALIAIENTRLFNETNDALERQTATADVLKVIASSPSDVQPVFDVIAASANRLMGGYSTTVWRHLDNMVHLAAYTPVNPTADAALRSVPPFSFSTAHYREQILEGRPVQFEDTENAIPRVAELARARGFRSLLIVPLMNKGRAIGSINVTRANVGSFAEADVQLLQTFADQAIIAIENSRLFDEVQARTGDLTEALQQQTATADVLQVISRSAFDLQSVLQTLAESAAQLSKTDMVNIWLRDGDVLRVQAHTGMTEAFHKFLQERPASPERGRFIGRAFLTGEIVHLPDVLDDPEYTFTGVPQMGGFRAVLGVPLVRDGRVEGVFGLARSTPGLFTAREIALVRTFADQAVIAIENARLFNETREALERQTTTADILKVIASSPSDVQPVFKAIAESAKRLLGGHSSLVTRVSGGMVHLAAFTEVDDARPNVLQTAFPYALSDDRPHSNVAVTGIPLIFPDTETENYGWRAVARARGYRSLVVIPMLRDGITIGTIGVTRRDPGPFTDNAIALLKTFADQAVIAIENVRLFNETKEALERQTATAEILKVIASSPSDVQPVFEAVVNSAAILFEPCSEPVPLV